MPNFLNIAYQNTFIALQNKKKFCHVHKDGIYLVTQTFTRKVNVAWGTFCVFHIPQGPVTVPFPRLSSFQVEVKLRFSCYDANSSSLCSRVTTTPALVSGEPRIFLINYFVSPNRKYEHSHCIHG